jgi:hypothetical protein
MSVSWGPCKHKFWKCHVLSCAARSTLPSSAKARWTWWRTGQNGGYT